MKGARPFLGKKGAGPFSGQALIVVLWIMSLLTAMVGAILVQSQHGLRLGEHPYAALQRRAAAEAAVYHALAVVRRDTEHAPAVDHLEEPWATGDEGGPVFDELPVGEARFAIGSTTDAAWSPGLLDEERKLNLNTAPPIILQRLLEAVGASGSAAELAAALVDWRDPEPGTWCEDATPACANRPFTSVEESRLVPGMTAADATALEPYVTVHGTGAVNVNTASEIVLQALGCPAAEVIMQRPHAAPPAICPSTAVVSTAFTAPIEAWVAPEGAHAHWRAILHRDGRLLEWQSLP